MRASLSPAESTSVTSVMIIIYSHKVIVKPVTRYIQIYSNCILAFVKIKSIDSIIYKQQTLYIFFSPFHK